ncbi:MAG: 3'-5' exonuclease [Acholeplasmataceae bacterium]|nr:3'-5' exonuclease [Acholeplasmataceae bacterium]
MLDHDKILLFDFETTGLSAEREQIIEIGAILLKKDSLGEYQIESELSTLVLADKPLPFKIIEITHITDEMLLRDGISQEEAFHRFLSMYSEDTLLVAYNIQFDLSFMIQFFKKYWDKNFQIKNDIMDVMAIYKDRHRYPHRLDQAVQTYQVEISNTHRALDDIKATYEAMRKMNAELDNLRKYVNVIGYNATYGVNGIKLPHVKYVAQKGGYREIERS